MVAACYLTSKTHREDEMSDTATTTLSSKGQVVIPEEIRERLGLKAGAQFVVLGDRDVVIFKVLQAPAARDYVALVKQARTVAKRTGMRRGDLTSAIGKARRGK
jgi:AbrB family looped-hinge helix DNA binding protein